jgi:general stress protein 26
MNHGHMKQTAVEFIGKHSCAVLATKGAERQIDLAYVCVVVEPDMTLYFMSKIETRKMENISRDSEVVMMFSDVDALQQIELRGSAEVLSHTDSIVGIFPRLQDVIKARRFEQWLPPVAQTPGEGYAVVRVVPDSLTYRDYKREDKDAGPHEFSIPFNSEEMKNEDRI